MMIDFFSDLNESQLLHYFEPEPGVFIAESPKVIERAFDKGYEPLALLAEEGHVKDEIMPLIDRMPQIPVYYKSKENMEQIKGYNLTRGALCAFRRKKTESIEELFCDASRIVVLDDVENPTNIGSIIRNAAAFGMDGLIITKGCSDPLYRRALRVSMGCALSIPFTYSEDDYIEKIAKLGFKTVAMALRNDTVDINDPQLENEDKLAIILGNEGNGLKDKILDKTDYTVKIPMSYGVDSLNVSAASAIAFWELRKGIK